MLSNFIQFPKSNRKHLNSVFGHTKFSVVKWSKISSFPFRKWFVEATYTDSPLTEKKNITNHYKNLGTEKLAESLLSSKT